MRIYHPIVKKRETGEKDRLKEEEKNKFCRLLIYIYMLGKTHHEVIKYNKCFYCASKKKINTYTL